MEENNLKISLALYIRLEFRSLKQEDDDDERLPDFIEKVISFIMHQAFNFSIFKALHCRAKFVVKSPLKAPAPGG